MVNVLQRINIHITVHHRHYQYGITVSSVTCCVISLSFPAYTSFAAVLGAITNIIWAWERTNG